MSGSPHDALDVAIRKARESLDEIEQLSGELRRKTQYVGVGLNEAIVQVLSDGEERTPSQIHRAIEAGGGHFARDSVRSYMSTLKRKGRVVEVERGHGSGDWGGGVESTWTLP